jgi:hypothetical protein
MSRTIRLAGVHIALAAMLLRALLPAGWMPNPVSSADSPFVICTMDGPIYMVPRTDGQPIKQQPDHNNDSNHEICPFAVAPHLAPPTIAVLLTLPSLAASALSKSSHPGLAESIARYSPQSPRAPPSLV